MTRQGQALMPLLLLLAAEPGCRREPPLPPSYAERRLAELETEVQGPPSALVGWGYPTDQTNLLVPDAAGVFQPTASGRPDSALYGSVRTQAGAKGLYASFHEGVDIAAVGRDKRGQPVDQVRALAPGAVAYANKIAGNSNYGIYVVLMHEDPLGSFYTLYAHLASVDPGIARGRPVARGDTLGIMGNTPASDIPMARAHVHVEIGLMLNTRFDAWARARRMTPDHGAYNGLNLAGLDPLDILQKARDSNVFSLRAYLADLPAAYAVLFKAERRLDFFRRYPGLWIGEPETPGAVIRVTVSEGGVPLRGRLATPEETAALGRAKVAIVDVDEDVLGRNGRRLILRHSGAWTLSRAGEDWLAVLQY